MPPTARMVAKRHKVRGYSWARMDEPELNVRIGGLYLGGLLKRWKGVLPMAVGSYNAGPGAMKRMRKRAPNLPMDVWVEEISIRQTREYVQRVLASAWTYAQLYPEPRCARSLQDRDRSMTSPGRSVHDGNMTSHGVTISGEALLRRLGFRRRVAQHAGLEVHYLEGRGRGGPDLVFLHGLGDRNSNLASGAVASSTGCVGAYCLPRPRRFWSDLPSRRARHAVDGRGHGDYERRAGVAGCGSADHRR